MIDWDVQDIFNRFNLHIGTTENVGRIDFIVFAIGASHFHIVVTWDAGDGSFVIDYSL